MTRKTDGERALGIIERPKQEYLWCNFYTYSKNDKTNKKIIKMLEDESVKLTVSYNLDMRKISTTTWWKKKVKKSGLSEKDYLKKYYNGVLTVEKKNTSKRMDCMALFMKGSLEIVDFFKMFPAFKKKIDKGSNVKIYEVLALKLIILFGEYQMWYNSLIVPSITTGVNKIELCNTKIFQNIVNNFYTPANVLTLFYEDPATKRKKNYIDASGNIVDKQAAIDRFVKLSGLKTPYNRAFINKVLDDGVKIYLAARKTNITTANVITELSIELQELYECKKNVEYFTKKFSEYLTSQQIDKDAFLFLRRFIDDPFYIYNVISEEKKKDLKNINSVLLYQLTVFMSMVQSTYLITDCNFSASGLKNMTKINTNFFALKYVMQEKGYTVTKNYIARHKDSHDFNAMLQISSSLHYISGILGDLEIHQDFSNNTWKDKLNFLTQTEFIWHLIKNYSSSRGLGGHFDLGFLSYFEESAEIITNWLFMRGTFTSEQQCKERCESINNLIRELLISNGGSIKSESMRLKVIDNLSILFLMSIIDTIVTDLEAYNYIERITGVQRKKKITMHSIPCFYSIPAWAIPLYKTEVEEATIDQELESSCYLFNEKQQKLSVTVSSIKHFLTYKSCRFINKSPRWTDNFDDIGHILNNFLVSAVQSFILKFSGLKNIKGFDSPEAMSELPKIYVEMNLQGERIFSSPKRKGLCSPEDFFPLTEEPLDYQDYSIEDLANNKITPYTLPFAFNIEKGVVDYNRNTDSELKPEELFMVNSKRLGEQLREYFDPNNRLSMWEKKRSMKSILYVEYRQHKIRPTDDENKDIDATHIYILDGLTIDLYIKKGSNHKIIKNENFYERPHLNEFTNLFLQSNLFSAINLLSYNGINHYWNSHVVGSYEPFTEQQRVLHTKDMLDIGLQQVQELNNFSSKLRDPGKGEWYFKRPNFSQYNVSDLLKFFDQLKKLTLLKIEQKTVEHKKMKINVYGEDE